ncbi:MAG TPA: hypothetical protein VG426_02025 [Candidatus Dormibacteraeota bacterium]|nr:hypothetical protein [Candidatus Dormibacteraeota bacterium]
MKAGVGVIGVLAVLVGGVFAGQGLGYIPGSFMTGKMEWFWIGGAIVVAGLVLLTATFVRRPKRV